MHCSRRATLATLLLALTPPLSAYADRKQSKLYLQPLGKSLFEADVLAVQKALVAFYDFPVELLPRRELPKSAYYPPRGRYRAEKLLVVLNERKPDDALKILGLTGVDISTTKPPHADWGILGLATIGGACALVSSFRTRRGASSAEHARIRFAKTAVHELGHTLGLLHCKSPACLMQDGQGSVTTTDRGYDLCTDCRLALRQRGYPLTGDEVAIPWERRA